MPPGDAACKCSYNYQTTIALMPTTRNEEWSVFPTAPVSPAMRIQHVAVNFGVPGDRRDADGQLWLAFPSPGGLAVPLETEFSAQGGYYRHNSDELVVQGTNSPWLYASGCRGLRSATLDILLERPSNLPERQDESHTVRLHFAELENLEPGQRVFDVKLQDGVVLEGLDIVKETGAANTALVKEFKGIRAGSTIKLELVPLTDREPIISAIEIHNE